LGPAGFSAGAQTQSLVCGSKDDGYTLGCSEKDKIWNLISNSDQTLPTGRYAKATKLFSKILVSSAPNRRSKFKKYDFYRK